LSPADLDEYMSRPVDAALQTMSELEGDLLVLGAGGKIGLSVCRMAARAWESLGLRDRRVIAVSRFADAAATADFHEAGVKTIAADLLDDHALAELPDVANVLYLAGMKFGASSDQPATWAMNTFLPGLVARRFRSSRIVALSTGNVYPFVPTSSRGSRESDPVGPVGEYAQSCLGRERIFAYHSALFGTPVTLVRLNYANALRYGVLTDVASAVRDGRPVDVTMGYVNVIWQGDVNGAILGSFRLCDSPPTILNVAGPEVVRVADVVTELGRQLAVSEPRTTGVEADTALLSDSTVQQQVFGPPTVPFSQLLNWTAAWVGADLPLLGKPTHFETRDGAF
jgi:nucleoside-diphosphate-sugar epimerase